jgi:hypothetical protein
MTDVTRIPALQATRITQVFEARPANKPTPIPDAPRKPAKTIEEVIAQRLEQSATAKPTQVPRDVPRGSYLDILV